MNETKTNWFITFLAKFSPKEFVALSLSILISIPILIYGFATQTEDDNQRGFTPIAATIPVYDTSGNRVQLFDTSFYISYENNVNDVERALVVEVLNEYLVPYHKLFDRHADYFATPVANPLRPTIEEQANTPRVHNLKMINDHLGEEIEVDYPLYQLIEESVRLSIKSAGYFNPFVGELTDLWTDLLGYEDYPSAYDPLVNVTMRNELERLVSFVPKTPEEIAETITLREDPIHQKHYVTLNPFNGATPGDLSLTLGGIAKGYLTDVMKEVMNQNKLYRGYINGGSSSITTLSDQYFGNPLAVNMASIYRDEDGKRELTPSFSFSRSDTYSMSTSGSYEGKLFVDESTGNQYLRNHILNPFTGYPANHSHQLVSVVSHELSGTELEILSTSLIVMSQAQGVAFIMENYTDIDFNIVYLRHENDGYYLDRNTGFPGENSTYFHLEERYRENFLEIA